MKTKNHNTHKDNSSEKINSHPPSLNIAKLEVISRDYGYKYDNGYRDFSQSLPDVLNLLDNKGCDAVLFSLFSIISRKNYNPLAHFKNLKNIKSIFLEHFKDTAEGRKVICFATYYWTADGWRKFELNQSFGTVTGLARQEIDNFVHTEIPKRIIGNACILLCGETNGVKYSKNDKKIHDEYGLASAIPLHVNIILNPVHDRMTRFEMKIKDGDRPAWTIYHNGNQQNIDIQKKFGVEFGIVDLT